MKQDATIVQWANRYMICEETRWTDWLTPDELFLEFINKKRSLDNHMFALEYFVHD